MVLTGATGSLGAALLSLLLADSTVQKVYCLSRGKDDADATRRVRNSMLARGYEKAFDGAREGRVVCLVSDLAKDDLGLNESIWREMKRVVTLIIHVSKARRAIPAVLN